MAYYHGEEEDDETGYAKSIVSIFQIQRGFGRPCYAGISHIHIGSFNQHAHGIGSFLGGFFRRVLIGYRGALEQLERRRYVLA